jgi:hypothetical protein
MLQIAWHWRPLYDEEVRQIFFVSPFFGSLHAVKSIQGDAGSIPFWAPALGCSSRTKREFGWTYAAVLPPTEAHTWYGPGAANCEWITSIRRKLHRSSLAMIVNSIETRAVHERGQLTHEPATEELIAEALGAWTFARDPECLPRALFRYHWLRSHGGAPSVVLGVHIPTDRMHAWIELQGNVIGEEPDEMLCYQSAVRFFSKCR